MTFPPALAPWSAAVAGAVIALTDCTPSGPATGYTPITGIQISSADIVAGHGCGLRTGQVYKYAAVVAYPTDAGASGAVVASGVFDCFADGIFSNLPTPDASPQLYEIAIYAYDKSSFPAELDCPPGAIPCPGDDAGAVLAWKDAANSIGTCTATELPGVTAVAACGPLAASPAPAVPPVRPSQLDAAAE